jgi:hypothetical protein
LTTLEHECCGLFAPLVEHDRQPPAGAEYVRRKAELIRDILADDAQIRLLVEPRSTIFQPCSAAHVRSSASSGRTSRTANDLKRIPGTRHQIPDSRLEFGILSLGFDREVQC